MTMKNIQLIQLSPDELVTLISEGVKKQLDDLKTNLNSNADQEELLSREATCAFLDIDSTTLWRWTQKGKLKSYAIAGRRYYKKKEIMAALKLNIISRKE